jgi:hypothetical protein
METPVQVYESVRLLFGDRSSPFLTQYVVRTHAKENEELYPLAADTCTKREYMDDAIDSLDTVAEVKSLREQLTQLLDKAGFTIRKWCSNSLEVLEEIPKEDRAPGILDLEESDLPCMKTLGVRWDARKDALGFSHTETALDGQQEDPAGLNSPVVRSIPTASTLCGQGKNDSTTGLD